MNNHKYVGMDVHKAITVITVLDSQGRVISESKIRTEEDTIKSSIRGLTGTVHVTLEEGTQSAWLHELISPLVAELIVCDPRRNKLISTGNKGDKVDSAKLAELLRMGSLKAVYHGETGIRKLKELVRLYVTLKEDSIRVMNRIKAIYRGRGISASGKSVYRPDRRREWMAKVIDTAYKARLEALYRQLDFLEQERKEARKAVVKEVRRHPSFKLLHSLPSLGPISIAIILATAVTPHRFRTKRQFWPYCGFGVVTVSSADYTIINDKVSKVNRPIGTRGLNRNYNRRMKAVFKSAARYASHKLPFKQYYDRLIAKGMRREMALLSLARKISAITLAVWKSGASFVPEMLNKEAA